jgi:hypothetical protein
LSILFLFFITKTKKATRRSLFFIFYIEKGYTKLIFYQPLPPIPPWLPPWLPPWFPPWLPELDDASVPPEIVPLT